MTRRHSIKALSKVIERSQSRTENARVAKRDRKAKKVAMAANTKPENVPDFELDYSDCGQTDDKVLSSYYVQAWFREGITKRVSWSVTLPSNDDWWKGKQRLLAKKLLKAYGGELTKKAIFYFCDHWEEMVKDSEGRLSGLPTVELLWTIRDRIFPGVERGVPYRSPKKRTVRDRRLDPDEYRDPGDDAIGHGW